MRTSCTLPARAISPWQSACRAEQVGPIDRSCLRTARLQSQSADRSRRAIPWAGRYMAPAAATYEHSSGRLREERQEKRVWRPSAARCAHCSQAAHARTRRAHRTREPQRSEKPTTPPPGMWQVLGSQEVRQQRGGGMPRPLAAVAARRPTCCHRRHARSEGRAATTAARRRRRYWRPWRVGWRPSCPCGSSSRWAPSRSSQAAMVAAERRRALLAPFRDDTMDCRRAACPGMQG